MNFNDQGLHAEDIGNDPNQMTPSGLAEGDTVAQILPVVVAPPAYVDPSNPAAASGSVNLPLDSHPLTISEDYGAAALDAGALTGAQSTLSISHGPQEVENEKPREDWTNADYKEALKKAGLSTSGNREELQSRLEEHESAQNETEDDNGSNDNTEQ